MKGPGGRGESINFWENETAGRGRLDLSYMYIWEFFERWEKSISEWR